MSTATLMTAVIAIVAQPGNAVRTTQVTHCVVKVIDEVKVPAQEPGALVAIEVREGQNVKEGDLVARLDHTDAQAKLKIAEAELRVAEAQADSEVRVQAAQAEAEVAETEFLRAEDILRQHDQQASQTRLKRLLLAPRQAHLKTDVAELDLAIAKLNQAVRAAQLKAAQDDLDRRSVDAPRDGVIVQIYRHVGEWVSPGEPIMHLVRMERLRVDGFISAAEFTPQDVINKPVEITVQLTRGRVVRLTSQISFASPIVESNGRFRVSAEVDNQRQGEHWQLRPGLTAEMTISVQ